MVIEYHQTTPLNAGLCQPLCSSFEIEVHCASCHELRWSNDHIIYIQNTFLHSNLAQDRIGQKYPRYEKSPKSMKLRGFQVPNLWGGSTSLSHLYQMKNSSSLDFKEKGTPYHPCFSGTGIGLKKSRKVGCILTRSYSCHRRPISQKEGALCIMV